MTPTLLHSGRRTANACPTSLYTPACFSDSMKIASASLNTSALSRVTSPPTMRIARPGPGNGCRMMLSSCSPSSRPRERTSSLNRSRSGSISPLNFSLSGSPPTLWWLLITLLGPLKLVLSITSGYKVPCSRYVRSMGKPLSFIARSNASMKSLPITFLFLSGSVIPASASKNSALASTLRSCRPGICSVSRFFTSEASSFLSSPVSMRKGQNRSPRARCISPAATLESTPPEIPPRT
mmetsp:Transcript_18086/g.45352  ORF Transcript_18086/g.45352 Transcript_18086/m.45352 type:complete len:238 (+) Transcript_18086:407-1120(+)